MLKVRLLTEEDYSLMKNGYYYSLVICRNTPDGRSLNETSIIEVVNVKCHHFCCIRRVIAHHSPVEKREEACSRDRQTDRQI